MSKLDEMRKRNVNGVFDRAIKNMENTLYGNKDNNDYEKKKEDLYYPKRNAEGNGGAIIRFIPFNDDYYVEYRVHGANKNKKYFIEPCPRTIGLPCPACEYKLQLSYYYKDLYGEDWKTYPEEVKKEIMMFSNQRGHSWGFYTNILVIRDPATPENEGKVFKFMFRTNIFDMIHDKLFPKEDLLLATKTPDPVDIFDLEVGANFNFIINSKEGRANYDKSAFDVVSKCPQFDPAMLHDIKKEMHDPSLFKDYEKLKERFTIFLKDSSSKPAAPIENYIGKQEEVKKEESKVPDGLPGNSNPPPDDEENMEYFRNLTTDIPF